MEQQSVIYTKLTVPISDCLIVLFAPEALISHIQLLSLKGTPTNHFLELPCTSLSSILFKLSEN